MPFHFESDQTGVGTWSDRQIAPVVTAKRTELDACAGIAGQPPREVTITLYIGNRGAVQSVGFASADPKQPIADAWASCAAKVVRAWTFTDPRGTVVKAAFRYRSGGE